MKIEPDLIKRIEDKILETYLLAQKIYGREFELCRYDFDLKSFKIAGRAWYQRNLIQLNPQHLAEHTNRIIDVTLPHEIAHLLTHKLFPQAKQAHGPEWRKIMKSIGLEPNPYHNMVIKSNSKYMYACGCGQRGFSPCLHSRAQTAVQMGKHYYRCRICKQDLLWVR